MKKISILFTSFLLLNLGPLKAQNIVADYPLNGNAIDISGYGLDGTLNGPLPVKDRFLADSGAFSFNGVDDYIEIPANTLTDLKDGFSISAWFNSTGDNIYQTIVSRGYASEGTYTLTVFNGGPFKVIRVELEGEIITGTTAIPDGWNHVLLVNELGASGVKIFLNGELYLSHTTANTYTASTAYNLRIGNNERNEDYFFDGFIDEVKIFDKSLDASDAFYLFNVTALNAELESADFGNALSFDGENDFIQLPSDILNTVTQGFTVETWVKWESTEERHATIFEIVQGGDQVQGEIKFGIQGLRSGSNFQSPCHYVVENGQAIDNDWHHLAVTVDVELNKAYYIVDGVVSYEFSFDTCAADGNCPYDYCQLDAELIANPRLYGLLAKDRVGDGQQYANLFNLGRSTNGDSFFKGKLDEFRIWDYPRSLAEIRSTRYLPITSNAEGLVYYLNFDEGLAGQNNKEVTNIPNKVTDLKGELLGFDLYGNASNWVESDLNANNLYTSYITDVFPENVNSGQLLTVSATKVPNDINRVKVLVGSKEAEIVSINYGKIVVIVPPAIKGNVQVEIVNALGTSNHKNIFVVNENASLAYTWNNKTIYSQIVPTTLETADFNQDGFVDILVGGRNQLVLFKNDRTGNFPEESIIQDELVNFTDLIASDLDGDGDVDILTVAGDELRWYRNEDKATNWTANLLFTGFSGIYIELLDVDRDGDQDLLAYGAFTGHADGYSAKLYLNNGSGVFDLGRTVIDAVPNEFLNRPKGFVAGDLNNDGFFDIVANTASSVPVESYKTVIYWGDRNMNFEKAIVGDAAWYAEIVTLGDINNDGLADIGNIGFQPSFNVFRNTGLLTFQNFNPGIGTLGANALKSGDMDGDGKVDFVGAFSFDKNQDSSQIKWFNQKNDSTYELENIPVNIYNAVDLRLVDLDNDGDLDIVTISDNDNRVTTIEHVYNGTNFYEYQVVNQVGTTTIDSINQTLGIIVPNNKDLFRVKPDFVLPLKSKAFINGVQQLSNSSEVNASSALIYTIKAESGNSSDWTVILNPLPGVPQISELDDITETGAELEWEATTYTDSYRIEVSDDDFDTFTVYETTKLDTVISLEPGTEYAVRMISVNAFGESEAYSEVEDFTTIPGQPVIDKIGNLTTSTAQIVWLENKGTDFYLLEVATDSSFSNYLPGFNPATIVGTNTNITVTNLEDGTNYYARLSSRNNDNESGVNSAQSIVVPFKTVLEIPSPPLAREASSVASNSFVANWDASTQGKEFRYIVEYSDDIAFQDSQFTEFLKPEQRAVSVTGLKLNTSYWYRVYTENVSGRSNPSNTVFVKKDLHIRNLQFDSLRDVKSVSRDTISFDVTGGRNKYVVGISYRGILSPNWTSREVKKQGDKYVIKILDSFLDEIGGEFELYVSDGTDTTSKKRNFIYWSDIESELPNLELEGKWQMFSIPYNFEDNLIETIFDEMGPYRYKKEWRLMQYDGSKYLDAGSGINRIELGESYWFYTLNKIAIALENGTVNTKTPFKMNLVPGWNQIGNPYNIPVSWNSVRSKNQVTETVGKAIGFNSSSQQFEDADIISPFEGAFVWSDEAEEVDISLVDNKAVRQLEPVELSGNNIDEDRWVQPLYLATGTSKASVVAAFGMHPEAVTSKDSFDKMQLPRFVNYTEMYTSHPEYFYSRFSQDIQQTSEAQSWLYTLESNENSGINTISWKNDGLKNSEKQLWLIDEEKGVLVNMNTESEYSFNWQGSYQFSVHLTASFEEKPIPYLLSIGDPFPNPVNDRVYLNLSLPKADAAYTVVINLLNIQGDYLASRTIKNVVSGFRELSLLTKETKPLISGVYFFQIQVVGEKTYNVTKKIVYQQ